VAVWVDAWGRATAQRLLLPAEGSVVLGRSHDCSCVMSHPTVSRRHARLTQTETGWTLRDLASSNGTYLNGARITDTALVHPGDEVWLGSVRLSLVRPQRQKR
jgi:pSer/pThr/pTyr-binding forkhead associated (FHA) protein